MSRKTFIKGTIILTLAGVLTKIFGFGYRIFLSRSIGSAGMGLYQLIMPVTAVCYAIGIAGPEVCVSRFGAAYAASGEHLRARHTAVFCFGISMILCVICTVLSYMGADIIAGYIFHNPLVSPLIRISVFSVPFACVHCLVCAYYIGKERTIIPAVSQVFEQAVRLIAVYIVVQIAYSEGREITAAVGAIGLVCGEIAAALLCATIVLIGRRKNIRKNGRPDIEVKQIIKTSLPVSLNRLALHGMQSLEAALIPLMLTVYGYSTERSVSIFGIITGMAMPVILFPSTLTGSVAQMLLPSVAKEQDSSSKLIKSSRMALAFSLIFGFVCIIGYTTAGAGITAYVFNEPDLVGYIRIMAWLCPFIFINTTYKSMLHALGQAGRVLINSMLSELINIICIVFLIPRMGIYAYLLGLLASQAANSAMSISSFSKTVSRITLHKPPQS
ncbi:MAG: oligosaccharide flippase family protein [Lachnospiraceae bacterium]|nr:oligosaccharide flippase family protein [Lachnospiraceae bacterium]